MPPWSSRRWDGIWGRDLRLAEGTWAGGGRSALRGLQLHFKLVFVQRRQDSCLVTRDTSGISSRLGRAIGTHLNVRRETQVPLAVAPGMLGFLSIFKRSQASSPFEALNSAHLSKCQKDVRPSVLKSWRTMAFCRVSTGDSVIHSSCEMKYEPAFKPLQGNPAFFWVRASHNIQVVLSSREENVNNICLKMKCLKMYYFLHANV